MTGRTIAILGLAGALFIAGYALGYPSEPERRRAAPLTTVAVPAVLPAVRVRFRFAAARLPALVPASPRRAPTRRHRRHPPQTTTQAPELSGTPAPKRAATATPRPPAPRPAPRHSPPPAATPEHFDSSG